MLNITTSSSHILTDNDTAQRSSEGRDFSDVFFAVIYCTLEFVCFRVFFLFLFD